MLRNYANALPVARARKIHPRDLALCRQFQPLGAAVKVLNTERKNGKPVSERLIDIRGRRIHPKVLAWDRQFRPFGAAVKVFNTEWKDGKPVSEPLLFEKGWFGHGDIYDI
jgi:hypothetical protein